MDMRLKKDLESNAATIKMIKTFQYRPDLVFSAKGPSLFNYLHVDCYTLIMYRVANIV